MKVSLQDACAEVTFDAHLLLLSDIPPLITKLNPAKFSASLDGVKPQLRWLKFARKNKEPVPQNKFIKE